MAVNPEDLDFLAPAVAGASLEDKKRAIAFAEAFRPACLTEAKQDLAQSYYAIWLLYNRIVQTQGMQEIIPGIERAGVKSLKEGDLAITFGETQVGEVDDPLGFYAKWDKLNKLCGYGAITASAWTRNCGC